MIEQLILGTIQGIAEWLPISSEGLLVLLHENILGGISDIEAVIRGALLLHFGTFLAALVYFRKEVWVLLKTVLKYRQAGLVNKKVLNFLVVSTLLSGAIGIALVKLLAESYDQIHYGGKLLTLFIGLLLLVTAGLQLRAGRKKGFKRADQLKISDGILLGLAQGLAALPGLSRSGLTTSVLLLRKFDSDCALKLSFLMSLPIVLAGNVILNINSFVISAEALIGLVASFVFGLLTINILLRVARKINFGYFLLFFGVLVIIASLIG